MSKTISDRRKHKRYAVADKTFAAISRDAIVGQVMDISEGGVSFTCVATQKKLEGASLLELFSKDKRLDVRAIPFTVVSETYVLNQNPCSSLPMKRIAGAFAQLTEHQESQISLFLQTCAAAEA